jgi:hypothetical protein
MGLVGVGHRPGRGDPAPFALFEKRRNDVLKVLDALRRRR